MRKIDPNNPSADRFQILEAIRAGVNGNETNWYVEMGNRVLGTVHRSYHCIKPRILSGSYIAILGILHVNKIKLISSTQLGASNKKIHVGLILC